MLIAGYERSRALLETARAEFHAMVDAMTPELWNLQSDNSSWSNGELLFHIALAFFLIRPLLRIIALSDALPPRCANVFSSGLDAATPLFNRVNALGPRLGARLLDRRRLEKQFDRTHDGILRALDRMDERGWQASMPFPTRWDPLFRPRMKPEDLVRYVLAHLRHHRSQLRTL